MLYFCFINRITVSLGKLFKNINYSTSADISLCQYNWGMMDSSQECVLIGGLYLDVVLMLH